MTLYDLTLVFFRQRLLLIITPAMLVVVILFGTLTFGDEGLTWRLAPRYEATVQIAVVPTSFDDLSLTDLGPGDFSAPANLFAELLGSTEAAVAVGESNGYELDETPQLEQDTPVAELLGPFDSVLEVNVDPGLVTDPGLFLVIGTALNSELALQLAPLAGGEETFAATLSPTMTLVLELQRSGAARTEGIRLSAPRLPQFVEEIPGLVMTIGPEAVLPTVDEATGIEGFVLDPSEISLQWVGRSPVPVETFDPVRDLKVVLLTPNPVPEPIGERRGPIVTIAALVVGLVLILAAAISVDTWQQQARAGQVDQEDDSAGIALVKRASSDHR